MSKRVLKLRKTQWYRMESFFDGPSQQVVGLGDAEVLLQGVLYEASFPCPKCGHKVCLDKMRVRKGEGERDGTIDFSPQLGLCLVPQEAISNVQGEGLRRMLEANLRMPVLLMSTNVQMAKLRPIHQAEADRILSEKGGEGHEGECVAIETGSGQGEQAGGQGVREAGGDGSAEDPGSPGAN